MALHSALFEQRLILKKYITGMKLKMKMLYMHIGFSCQCNIVVCTVHKTFFDIVHTTILHWHGYLMVTLTKLYYQNITIQTCWNPLPQKTQISDMIKKNESEVSNNMLLVLD